MPFIPRHKDTDVFDYSGCFSPTRDISVCYGRDDDDVVDLRINGKGVRLTWQEAEAVAGALIRAAIGAAAY